MLGAVLVANGELRWTPELTALAAAAPALLAADGGADHLARVGIPPTAVVGDLDSISAATRAWVGEDRLVHLPDQDRTDLEKAMVYAFDELAVPGLTVLGALGGRPDHELGNLGLLARMARGLELLYLSGDGVMLAVEGVLKLPAEAGETWSFWTFDPAVRVTLRGVEWPVEGADLSAAARPSVSNRASGDRVVVESVGGAVVVFRQRRP